MVQLSNQEILHKLDRQKTYFKDKGGLTISGGEPLLQAKSLVSLLQKVKDQGYHTAIDTCGGVFNQDTQQVFSFTDLVMLDVKHIDPDWHQKITGGALKTVLDNALFREKQNKPLWLKYVLVPGLTDQPQYLHQWAETFQDFTSLQKVEILPYHQLGVHKYQSLGREYQLTETKPPTEEEIAQAKQVFISYFGSSKVKVH
jgi:pyruvate formate lyase activating enzyme